MASVVRGSDNFDSSIELPLGDGQSWTQFAVGTERIEGTNYTNSTGRAIAFAILTNDAGSSNTVNMYVDGVSVVRYGAGVNSAGGFMIVPNGSTYTAISATGTLGTWYELR